MAKRDLTAERLRECLSYNKDTGLFTWIKPTSNRVSVGYVPKYLLSNGYLAIRIDGYLYLSHRLAWLYCNGNWPEKDIDHINGCRTDNRICNLRDVSRSINLQNKRGARRDSKTGFLGVTKDKNKFSARIQVGGEKTMIHGFDTPEEAHKAYISMKRMFHVGNTL